MIEIFFGPEKIIALVIISSFVTGYLLGKKFGHVKKGIPKIVSSFL